MVPLIRLSWLLTVLILAVGSIFAVPPNSPNVQLEPTPLYDDNDAYCLATFTDPDDSNGKLEFNLSVAGSQEKVQLFSPISNNTRKNVSLPRSAYNEGDEVLCNVTATASGNSELDSESVIADTFDPEVVSGPNFFNYSSEHAFNVSAVILDRESDDEVSDCRLNAPDLPGPISMNIDRTFGNNNQLRCFYSHIDNSSSYDVLEDVEVNITAEDFGGGIGNKSAVNPIPNSPPRVFDVQPSNNAVISSDSVDLRARITDQDGEKTDVEFINSTGSSNNVVDSFSGVSPGDEKQYSWSNLNQLKTYFWQINMSDDHQNITRKFRFRVRFPSQSRVQTQFESPYNSVLLTPNTSRTVRYSVYNDGNTAKSNLETTVYTADGKISSTGLKSSNQYSLQPGERKFFNIIISPDEMGKSELVVATDSSNLALNTTETFDLYVDERTNAATEIPGIGAFQLLVILLSSALYYSVRL